ncbi:MAG: leucine-rich repeat domain-containing protein [Bacteroidales bacterium]|nr:leucine-rich repeat domain-containing protein [Bacteroidales bacterium]
MTSVTIPGSVQKPGMYSFRGCKNLTSATLQEGIPYVDTGMFVDCEKLTSVSIPESVTHIGSVAFSGCKSLASLTLPSGLKKLEGVVFRNCTSLKTITNLATTPPELRADGTTFNGFDRSQCTLIVSKGCAAKYRAADGWKEFKKIVEK